MIVTRSASRKFLQVTAMMSTTFSCARHCFYEPNQRKVAICICILLESVIFDFWGHFRLVVTLLRRFSLIECHERRGGENQRRGPGSDSDDMVTWTHILLQALHNPYYLSPLPSLRTWWPSQVRCSLLRTGSDA